MLENLYYIPPHAISAFSERICNTLTTEEIRDTILLELKNGKIIDYERYNHKIQPVYMGQYKGKKFYMPIVEDKKKKDKCLVVPTILTPEMKIYNKDLECCTATEIATELNIDRSTVVDWINKGKIKAKNHTKRSPWGIYNLELKRVQKDFKPKSYCKYSKSYSKAEIHIIINNKDKSPKYIVELIGRNANSVKIKRCRMRKEGYDV